MERQRRNAHGGVLDCCPDAAYQRVRAAVEGVLQLSWREAQRQERAILMWLEEVPEEDTPTTRWLKRWAGFYTDVRGSMELAFPATRADVLGGAMPVQEEGVRVLAGLAVSGLWHARATRCTRCCCSLYSAHWGIVPPSVRADWRCGTCTLTDRMASGRCLLTHAIATNHERREPWLEALPRALENVPSSKALMAAAILMCDKAGFNALDYALKLRQPALLRMLLPLVWAGCPPHARRPLIEEPMQTDKLPFLIELAWEYPQVVADALEALDLDAYMHPNAPDIRRAPIDVLDAADGQFALTGSATSVPTVYSDAANSRGKVPGCKVWQAHYDAVEHRLSSLAHRCFGSGQLSREKMKNMQLVDVECRILGLPKLLHVGLVHEWRRLGLFNALVEASYRDNRIIGTRIMKAAIAFMWNSFGRARWLTEILVFALYCVSFAGMLLILAPPEAEGLDPTSSRALLGWGLAAVTALINLRYCAEEWSELVAEGVDVYFRNMWNVSESMLYGLMLAMPYLFYAGHSSTARTLGAVCMLLIFYKAMQISRGSERMAFLVAMLEEIVKDMGAFMVIIVFVLTTGGFAIWLESINDGETGAQYAAEHAGADFSDPISAPISLYTILMLGHGDLTRYFEIQLGSERGSRRALMLTYLSFLVTVVMLNALIAIMSDTYDRVQVTRHERGYRQRARLLLEMMHSMPAHQLTDRTMFPEWVHAIVRTDTGGNVERSEEHLWTGRVSAIRDRVDAVSEEQRTRLEELKTRMDEMRQDMAAMLQVQRERIHMKKVSFKDESRQAHWSDEHRSVRAQQTATVSTAAMAKGHLQLGPDCRCQGASHQHEIGHPTRPPAGEASGTRPRRVHLHRSSRQHVRHRRSSR